MSILTALEEDVTSYVDIYRAKRDRMLEGLSGCFEITKPGGAFYMFVKAPERYANATEFVKKAIENNVLVIPGNVFSERDSHFRVSYATADSEIQRGCGILRELSNAYV